MRKLVVSDMDGTLLRDDQFLDKEAYPMIHALRQQDVGFVAASGRQYHSLKTLFAHVAQDVYFICDNGALVMHQGDALYTSIMEERLVQKILKEVVPRPNASVMLCGRHQSYTNNKRQEAFLKASSFQFNITYTEDFLAVEEDVLKVSVVEDRDAYQTMMEMQQQFGREAKVTFSGYDCIDFMNSDVDKGAALGLLQKHLGISVEDTIVFGDNYNDVEMMEQAGTAFAMRHSPSGVKEKATRVLGSNNDGVVLQEIKTLFGLK